MRWKGEEGVKILREGHLSGTNCAMIVPQKGSAAPTCNWVCEWVCVVVFSSLLHLFPLCGSSVHLLPSWHATLSLFVLESVCESEVLMFGNWTMSPNECFGLGLLRVGFHVPIDLLVGFFLTQFKDRQVRLWVYPSERLLTCPASHTNAWWDTLPACTG